LIAWRPGQEAGAFTCWNVPDGWLQPVPENGAAGRPGVPGQVGTITRTGGSHQLTDNGHPLYTYICDSVPGQAKGNNLNLNGGLWHEVSVSRQDATALRRACDVDVHGGGFAEPTRAAAGFLSGNDHR
jgi:secreted repeat protein with Y-X4-D motif